MSFTIPNNLSELVKGFLSEDYKIDIFELNSHTETYLLRILLELKLSKSEVRPENVADLVTDALEKTAFVKSLKQSFAQEVAKLNREIELQNQIIKELTPYKEHYNLSFYMAHGRLGDQ
jgi:hypothetical protein